jgi:ribonuclease III
LKRVFQNLIDYLAHLGETRPEEPAWVEQARRFQRTIGYSFSNPSLLRAAMMHVSYFRKIDPNPASPPMFERLEFLGDSVLGLVTAEELYQKFPDLQEGELSKMKSKLVSEKHLARAAREIELGLCLLMSEEEIRGGGRNKDSILADAVEALICAIYIDTGMREAKKFIIRHVLNRIDEAVLSEELTNYKSILQEYCQSIYRIPPDYRVTREDGPDHRKTFTVEVSFAGEVAGEGSGSSKKAAEQQAAAAVCRRLRLG